MAANIRFHYQFRDSGNYKKFGHCNYSNSENLSLEDAEKQIRQHLIDGEYFFPEQAGIHKFRFRRYIDDYSWYEFCGLEYVEGRRSKETFEELIYKLAGNIIPALDNNDCLTCPFRAHDGMCACCPKALPLG